MVDDGAVNSYMYPPVQSVGDIKASPARKRTSVQGMVCEVCFSFICLVYFFSHVHQTKDLRSVPGSGQSVKLKCLILSELFL